MAYGSPYGPPGGPPGMGFGTRPPGVVALKPPTNITAEVSGSDIVISWTAAKFVDSYNVYTSIDGGAWTLLGNSATTSYSFTPTEPGEYNFRVTSVRGTQESAPSAETLYDEMMETVYSDTITGLRISALPGTAFVDGDEFLLAAEQTPVSGTLHIATKDGEAMFFHDSIDFSTYAGTDAGSTPYRLVFTDAAGKKAEAYGGAVGGGEALSAELITTWINGITDPMETLTVNANGKDLDAVINSTANGFANTNSLAPVGRLLKINRTITSGTGISFFWTPGGVKNFGSNNLVDVYHTANHASGEGHHSIYTSGACNFSQTTSSKAITDIPATGLHLMSTMNGTTRNMASVETGFNPNTVTSVKIYHALADGNHLLEIEDSLGNIASGVLSEQGSGVTLGAVINTGTLTADALYQIVSTEADHFGAGLVADDYFTSDGTETCDANNTVKQVTAPSTSGAVIVNAINGTTENFFDIETGFTRNQASHICRVKKILPTA